MKVIKNTSLEYDRRESVFLIKKLTTAYHQTCGLELIDSLGLVQVQGSCCINNKYTDSHSATAKAEECDNVFFFFPK